MPTEERITVVREDAPSLVTTVVNDTDDEVVIGTEAAPGREGEQGEQGEQGDQGDQGETGDTGLKGDKGDKGDQGDVGPAGSSFVWEQSPALAVWDIPHNLGFFPNVSVFDSAGTPQDGIEEHVDVNNLRITFKSAFGGKAILS